jgi:hypothetical protein
MTDKNGTELRTGDVVLVSGAYFANDNGLFFVEKSPGDPVWSGDDYLLRRITKKGEPSKGRKSISFYPIQIFTNSHEIRRKANAWNSEHVTIEVLNNPNYAPICGYFRELYDEVYEELSEEESRYNRQYVIAEYKRELVYYLKVIDRLTKKHLDALFTSPQK